MMNVTLTLTSKDAQTLQKVLRLVSVQDIIDHPVRSKMDELATYLETRIEQAQEMEKANR